MIEKELQKLYQHITTNGVVLQENLTHLSKLLYCHYNGRYSEEMDAVLGDFERHLKGKISLADILQYDLRGLLGLTVPAINLRSKLMKDPETGKLHDVPGLFSPFVAVYNYFYFYLEFQDEEGSLSEKIEKFNTTMSYPRRWQSEFSEYIERMCKKREQTLSTARDKYEDALFDEIHEAVKQEILKVLKD